MKGDVLVAAVFAAALATAAVAQKGSGSSSAAGSGSGSGSGAASGFDTRQVASFPDTDVESLLDGRGMGLALPAELNGYPGPMHILELTQSLGLSVEQAAKTQDIFDRMKARAREAGARYIDAEKALDAEFKSGKADKAAIDKLTRDADARRAEKRLSHLDAHLEAREVLSAEQLAKYAELRGYTTPARK